MAHLRDRRTSCTRRAAALALLVVVVACSGGRSGDGTGDGTGVARRTAGGGGPAGTTAGAAQGSADTGLVVTLDTDDNSPRPLGEPLHVALTVANSGSRSVSVPVDLTLVAPDGTELAFHRTSLFAPFGDRVTEDVVVTTSRWYDATGTFEVRADVTDGSLDAAPGAMSFEVGDTDRSVPRFEDVTAAAGLTTQLPVPECGQFATGAAWGDVNGDGWPDLVVARIGEPTQLFVNRGDGTFADDSAARGAAATDVNGIAMADYDNDGDVDVMLVGDGRDHLLRNDGTGHFADATDLAGVAGEASARGMSASFGDFDSDGLLDLYVTNYMTCTGPWTTAGEIISNVAYHDDVLYHNEGDGTFADVTSLLPGTDVGAAGFTAAWIDVDGDHRPDLYAGNDFVGLSPDHNRLWRNAGPGAGGWTFEDVSLASGAGLYMNTMGIAAGDVDRDGDVDLAMSNIGGNKLLRGAGDGTFVEETGTGIERPLQGIDYNTVTWGAVFADLDLDGWDDLFMAAGNLPQGPEVPVGLQPDMVFLNDGTGQHFLDVSALTGADDDGEGKGVAMADYDRDGDLDVFVVNQAGTPHLYRNVTDRGDRHWLELDLVGTVSNRDGCGATVTVGVAGGTIDRTVLCGSGGTGSGNEHAVHVGLGAADAVDRVEVLWPSGVRQVVDDVAVDTLTTVVETGG